MPNTILVFKTNVNTLEQIKKINNILSGQTEIKKWNIDMEDCDKVLRIETSQLGIENVLAILKPSDIFCEEME